MKIIFASDFHADVHTQGVDRYPEIEAAVMESVNHAVAVGADMYIFCGDLADPHNPRSHRASRLAHKADDALKDEVIQRLWLTGNHDVLEDGTGESVLSSLGETSCLLSRPRLFKAWSKEEGSSVHFHTLNIVALPFTPTSHSYDPVEFIANQNIDNDLPILVIGHLNLKGITAGSETIDMPRGRDVFWPVDEIKAKWPKAIMVGGHYHERQVYKGVQIIGSLARLTYGEGDNDVGYLELEI